VLCRGDDANGQCVMHSQSQKKTNYMGNQDRQGNYWKYNQGWKSHPSMGQVGPSNRPPQQHQQPFLHKRTLKMEETFKQFMQVSISNHNNTKASIQNFETQMSQLAQKLEEKLIKKI